MSHEHCRSNSQMVQLFKQLPGIGSVQKIFTRNDVLLFDTGQYVPGSFQGAFERTGQRHIERRCLPSQQGLDESCLPDAQIGQGTVKIVVAGIGRSIAMSEEEEKHSRVAIIQEAS